MLWTVTAALWRIRYRTDEPRDQRQNEGRNHLGSYVGPRPTVAAAKNFRRSIGVADPGQNSEDDRPLQ